MVAWGVVLNKKVAYCNHLSQLLWSFKLRIRVIQLACDEYFPKLLWIEDDMQYILLFNCQKFTDNGKNFAHKIIPLVS